MTNEYNFSFCPTNATNTNYSNWFDLSVVNHLITYNFVELNSTLYVYSTNITVKLSTQLPRYKPSYLHKFLSSNLTRLNLRIVIQKLRNETLWGFCSLISLKRWARISLRFLLNTYLNVGRYIILGICEIMRSWLL